MSEQEIQYVDFYREKMGRIFESKKQLLGETEEARFEMKSLHKKEDQFVDEMRKFENKLISLADLKVTHSDQTQNLLEIQRKHSILKLHEYSLRKKLLESLPTSETTDCFYKDLTMNKTGKKLEEMKGLPTNNPDMKIISVKDHVFLFTFN